MAEHYDAIVVGATPEGTTAAVTGASLGMRVAMVDPFGFLLSRGQLPGALTLSLVRDTVMEIRSALRVLGRESTSQELRALFSRTLAARRREVERAYHAETRKELIASGIPVVRGRAHVRSGCEVEVEGGVLRADVIVLATGSRPRRPTRFPFDEATICDVDGVATQDLVPRNLLVIGADLAGCEFSCMFAAVGTDVTLVDRRMRLLRFVDADLRGILHEWMQRSGITVVLGDEVERVEVTSSGDGRYASVSLGSGRTEIVERVLVAAGSDPNTVGLGLELARVEVDPRGFVSANDRFETSVPGIYATGGVVDGLASTTMRIHQARLAMFSAAGLGGDEENPTPMVVYTVPEIATVGLSEEACGLLDIPHVVGRSGLYRSPASAIRGKGEGLMKLVVCSRTHRLLGVHVIGSTAAELVGLGAAFLRRQGRVEEIASTGVSPKSMSEAYHRAALDALSQLGSVVRPRRPAAGPPTSESF